MRDLVERFCIESYSDFAAKVSNLRKLVNAIRGIYISKREPNGEPVGVTASTYITKAEAARTGHEPDGSGAGADRERPCRGPDGSQKFLLHNATQAKPNTNS